MKKLIYAFIIFTYATFLGLGETCLLTLVGITFGVSLDGGSVLAEYPRFIPFCVCAGFCALIFISVLVFLNVRWSKKLGYTKKMWTVQWIFASGISIPMIKLWEIFFGYLQKIF